METAQRIAPEVECPGVLATAEEWAAVRASLVDVAARAAFLGYASDRLGRWEISAQRQAVGTWPPGLAALLVTLVCGCDIVRRWRAEVSMDGALP
jgi:hypothetical protein